MCKKSTKRGTLVRLSKSTKRRTHPENLTLRGIEFCLSTRYNSLAQMPKPGCQLISKDYATSSRSLHLRVWLERPYISNIPDFGTPEFFITGQLFFSPEMFKMPLSSSYADSDHFRSNSCTEKNPGNIANLGTGNSNLLGSEKCIAVCAHIHYRY